MPDKEGSDDEKKSTKSVVNKKQKQMMGEEGYDIARDMGRVRPSKDKKDATTMPPSKEMEKTRKVNKGPSALERVKKKYRGQIMDVKKEELDLTQVAEAFGGYIVEEKGEKIGKVKPGEKEASLEAIRKAAEEPKLSPSGQKRLAKISKPTKITDKNFDDIMKAIKGKSTATSRDLETVANRTKSGSQSRPPVATPPPTQGNVLTGGQDEVGKKTRKKRSDAGQKRGKPNRRRYFADPNTKQLQLDLTKKVGRQQVKQDVAKIVKNPRQTARAVLQRTFLTPDKGVRGLLQKLRKEPVTTAIAAGVARDSFRNPMPQLQMPTVKGGKVGKRTAG